MALLVDPPGSRRQVLVAHQAGDLLVAVAELSTLDGAMARLLPRVKLTRHGTLAFPARYCAGDVA
jgi:hypothetical protein